MKREMIFLGLVGGLVAYELAALKSQQPGDTISEIIWTATSRRPLVPFAFGLLMGHFFWQRAESPASSPAPQAL